MAATHGFLAEHFENYEQQHAASSLGMWVFLITEVMFFGALFLIYTVGRAMNPAAFAAASREIDATLGGINTGVLILSSFTMALAVRAAQRGRSKPIVAFLGATVLLGCVFLFIKSYEYYMDYQHHLIPGWNFSFPGPHAGGAEHYFTLYFAMTGLHAVHMIIGITIVLILMLRAWRGRFTQLYHNPVEMIGLYWHFVDIIWIFLFPLFYLIDLHH